MKCEEIVIELDAYLTGELNSKMAGQVERHLGQCAECRAELLALRRENTLYQDYRSTLELPVHAWGAIQMRIASVPVPEDVQSASPDNPQSAMGRSAIRRTWWVWAMAASVLVAAGLSLHYYRLYKQPEPVPPGLSPVMSHAIPSVQPPMDKPVEDVVDVAKSAPAPKRSDTGERPYDIAPTQGVEQVVSFLQATYEEKKPELDPQLVELLDRNLKLTRTAIDECERALKRNPHDRQAAEFLVLGYEQQINILRQVTEDL